MTDLRLRLATVDDLEAMNSIYNHYVLNSVTTYQEDPESIESRRRWFARHGGKHPVTVAMHERAVIGWSSLSPFHTRSAYRHTVKNAVYVHPDHHRRGVGVALLTDLIERARAAGHHAIIAEIDSQQIASIGLHKKMGFVEAAHLREVGRKFECWLDVYYMQKIISPPPPSSLPRPSSPSR